jgi:PKHD-type hydroxylase
MNLLIPPINTFGLSPYAYWENFLSDDDIKTILSLKEWHKSTKAEIGGASSSTVDTQIRNSKISWMEYSSETVQIWNKLLLAISEVNSRYFHFDLSGCYEPAQLTMYNSSNLEHYTWHCDSSYTDRSIPRKLSMSLLLSDESEFKGGDLEVLVDSEKTHVLNQKRGRAWFFPSYMLHRVSPVTYGIRRSLVLWIGGPNFK